PGVTVQPQILAAGQKSAVLVVTAAPNASPWVGALRLVGTAEVNGRKLVRSVRGASVTWAVPQQNIPAISRLDLEAVLAVRGQTQPPKVNQPPQKGAPPNLVEYASPITLTVVPKQLVKLTVTPTPAKIQLGKQIELTVRAARQTELALDLKLDVVFPPNAA